MKWMSEFVKVVYCVLAVKLLLAFKLTKIQTATLTSYIYNQVTTPLQN